jgi:hypothetical protein
MLFFQLLGKFNRVQLDSLEAQLRPVEQARQGRRAWVQIFMDMWLTNFKGGHIRLNRQTQFTFRAASACKLPH